MSKKRVIYKDSIIRPNCRFMRIIANLTYQDMDVSCRMIVWIHRHGQHKHLHRDYIVFFVADSCYPHHKFLNTPHFAILTILTNMALLD